MSLLKERLAAVMKFYGINKIQLCTILEISPDLLTKAYRFQRTLSSTVNLKIYELEGAMKAVSLKLANEKPKTPPQYYSMEKTQEVVLKIKSTEHLLSKAMRTFYEDQTERERLNISREPDLKSKIGLAEWLYHKDMRILDLDEKIRFHCQLKIFPLEAKLAGLKAELNYWKNLYDLMENDKGHFQKPIS